jgi:Zinc finger, C2H2 type
VTIFWDQNTKKTSHFNCFLPNQDIRFDNFTKIVCQPCADNVIIAYKTKIQCLLSDATLRSTVKCEDPKQNVDSEPEFEDEQELEVLDEDEQMELEELYDKQYEQKLVIEAIDDDEEVELDSMVEEDNTEPDENQKFLYDEHFVDENELPLDKNHEVDESEEEEEYGEEEYVEEYLGDVTTGSKTARGPNQNSMYLRSCCQCLEMFEDEDEVIVHFAATHAERIKHHIKLLPPDAKRKQCVLCHTLVRHIQTHRRRKHFKDYQCRVDEGGIKTFECETCGIRFATQNKLNNHIKYNHSKTANLRSQIQEITVCPICKLATKSACNLDKHLLEMHPDTKSIECKVCNKKLKLATSLKKHMMIHFSERTFNCDMCDEKYLYSCGESVN